MMESLASPCRPPTQPIIMESPESPPPREQETLECKRTYTDSDDSLTPMITVESFHSYISSSGLTPPEPEERCADDGVDVGDSCDNGDNGIVDIGVVDNGVADNDVAENGVTDSGANVVGNRAADVVERIKGCAEVTALSEGDAESQDMTNNDLNLDGTHITEITPMEPESEELSMSTEDPPHSNQHPEKEKEELGEEMNSLLDSQDSIQTQRESKTSGESTLKVDSNTVPKENGLLPSSEPSTETDSLEKQHEDLQDRGDTKCNLKNVPDVSLGESNTSNEVSASKVDKDEPHNEDQAELEVDVVEENSPLPSSNSAVQNVTSSDVGSLPHRPTEDSAVSTNNNVPEAQDKGDSHTDDRVHPGAITTSNPVDIQKESPQSSHSDSNSGEHVSKSAEDVRKVGESDCEPLLSPSKNKTKQKKKFSFDNLLARVNLSASMDSCSTGAPSSTAISSDSRSRRKIFKQRSPAAVVKESVFNSEEEEDEDDVTSDNEGENQDEVQNYLSRLQVTDEGMEEASAGESDNDDGESPASDAVICKPVSMLGGSSGVQKQRKPPSPPRIAPGIENLLDSASDITDFCDITSKLFGAEEPKPDQDMQETLETEEMDTSSDPATEQMITVDSSEGNHGKAQTTASTDQTRQGSPEVSQVGSAQQGSRLFHLQGNPPQLTAAPSQESSPVTITQTQQQQPSLPNLLVNKTLQLQNAVVPPGGQKTVLMLQGGDTLKVDMQGNLILFNGEGKRTASVNSSLIHGIVLSKTVIKAAEEAKKATVSTAAAPQPVQLAPVASLPHQEQGVGVVKQPAPRPIAPCPPQTSGQEQLGHPLNLATAGGNRLAPASVAANSSSAEDTFPRGTVRSMIASNKWTPNSSAPLPLPPQPVHVPQATAGQYSSLLQNALLQKNSQQSTQLINIRVQQTSQGQLQPVVISQVHQNPQQLPHQIYHHQQQQQLQEVPRPTLLREQTRDLQQVAIAGQTSETFPYSIQSQLPVPSGDSVPTNGGLPPLLGVPVRDNRSACPNVYKLLNSKETEQIQQPTSSQSQEQESRTDEDTGKSGESSPTSSEYIQGDGSLKHCQLCNRLFIKEETFEKHLQTAEGHWDLWKEFHRKRQRMKYICTDCKKIFVNREALLSHKEYYHGSGEGRFPHRRFLVRCTLCHLRFKDDRQLFAHLHKCHPESQETPTTESLTSGQSVTAFSLSGDTSRVDMPSAVVNNKPSLTVTNGITPSTLTIMGLSDSVPSPRGFGSGRGRGRGRGRRNPLKIRAEYGSRRSGEREDKGKSDIGGRIRIEYVNVNARTKAGKLRRKSSDDGQTFIIYKDPLATTMDLVGTHGSYVTGDLRPYKCKLCPKNFNSNHCLLEHIKIHVKPYSCGACGLKASRKDNVAKHIELVHGGPKYVPKRQPLTKERKVMSIRKRKKLMKRWRKRRAQLMEDVTKEEENSVTLDHPTADEEAVVETSDHVSGEEDSIMLPHEEDEGQDVSMQDQEGDAETAENYDHSAVSREEEVAGVRCGTAKVDQVSDNIKKEVDESISDNGEDNLGKELYHSSSDAEPSHERLEKIVQPGDQSQDTDDKEEILNNVPTEESVDISMSFTAEDEPKGDVPNDRSNETRDQKDRADDAESMSEDNAGDRDSQSQGEEEGEEDDGFIAIGDDDSSCEQETTNEPNEVQSENSKDGEGSKEERMNGNEENDEEGSTEKPKIKTVSDFLLDMSCEDVTDYNKEAKPRQDEDRAEDDNQAEVISLSDDDKEPEVIEIPEVISETEDCDRRKEKAKESKSTSGDEMMMPVIVSVESLKDKREDVPRTLAAAGSNPPSQLGIHQQYPPDVAMQRFSHQPPHMQPQMQPYPPPNMPPRLQVQVQVQPRMYFNAEGVPCMENNPYINAMRHPTAPIHVPGMMGGPPPPQMPPNAVGPPPGYHQQNAPGVGFQVNPAMNPMRVPPGVVASQGMPPHLNGPGMGIQAGPMSVYAIQQQQQHQQNIAMQQQQQQHQQNIAMHQQQQHQPPPHLAMQQQQQQQQRFAMQQQQQQQHGQHPQWASQQLMMQAQASTLGMPPHMGPPVSRPPMIHPNMQRPPYNPPVSVGNPPPFQGEVALKVPKTEPGEVPADSGQFARRPSTGQPSTSVQTNVIRPNMALPAEGKNTTSPSPVRQRHDSSQDVLQAVSMNIIESGPPNADAESENHPSARSSSPSDSSSELKSPSGQKTKTPRSPRGQGSFDHKYDPERPFICHICGKGFKRRNNLTDHVRTHTRPYKCGECAFDTIRWQYLAEHMKKAHGFAGDAKDLEMLFKSSSKKLIPTDHIPVASLTPAKSLQMPLPGAPTMIANDLSRSVPAKNSVDYDFDLVDFFGKGGRGEEDKDSSKETEDKSSDHEEQKAENETVIPENENKESVSENAQESPSAVSNREILPNAPQTSKDNNPEKENTDEAADSEFTVISIEPCLDEPDSSQESNVNEHSQEDDVEEADDIPFQDNDEDEDYSPVPRKKSKFGKKRRFHRRWAAKSVIDKYRGRGRGRPGRPKKAPLKTIQLGQLPEGVQGDESAPDTFAVAAAESNGPTNMSAEGSVSNDTADCSLDAGSSMEDEMLYTPTGRPKRRTGNYNAAQVESKNNQELAGQTLSNPQHQQSTAGSSSGRKRGRPPKSPKQGDLVMRIRLKSEDEQPEVIDASAVETEGKTPGRRGRKRYRDSAAEEVLLNPKGGIELGAYYKVTRDSQRPFSCAIEDCNKTFKSKQHMREHLFTHLKPYRCDHCGVGYARTDYLAFHMKDAHGTYPTKEQLFAKRKLANARATQSKYRAACKDPRRQMLHEGVGGHLG